jgi:glycosyltransferase involved in cell wall biosynthesis
MTYYLAYLPVVFVVFQFVNVLFNFIFMQKINRTNSMSDGMVSLLIPARNEEQNISFLLNDLRKINNNSIEIIVFDDQSTDNTYNLVKQHAENDKRIKLITSEGLPNKWLGKNYACHQLAAQANGHYFLFVDADVRLCGKVIEDSVCYLKKHHLELLSAFPIQTQKTFSEKLTVPIMNYILLTLLPLIFVRISPFYSHAAANGQFMLFNAKSYKKNLPHQLFKNSPVEDIAIAKYYKKKGVKIACITGDSRIKCRMYKSYHEALNGFSKNIFMFFGNKPALAFIFWLFSSMGFIPLLIFQPLVAPFYFLTLACVLLLYSTISKQNPILNLLLYPLHLFFIAQLMIKSSINTKLQQYSWKGRNIY